MDIIVAREKHGTCLYALASDVIRARLEDGFWYDNSGDGNPKHQWEDRAREAFESNDENIAWRFLMERNDYEYESVSWEKVQ